jgi:hypothetical protein
VYVAVVAAPETAGPHLRPEFPCQFNSGMKINKLRERRKNTGMPKKSVLPEQVDLSGSDSDHFVLTSKETMWCSFMIAGYDFPVGAAALALLAATAAHQLVTTTYSNMRTTDSYLVPVLNFPNLICEEGNILVSGSKKFVTYSEHFKKPLIPYRKRLKNQVKNFRVCFTVSDLDLVAEPFVYSNRNL